MCRINAEMYLSDAFRAAHGLTKPHTDVALNITAAHEALITHTPTDMRGHDIAADHIQIALSKTTSTVVVGYLMAAHRWLTIMDHRDPVVIVPA
jgi:hypothetical protein